MTEKKHAVNISLIIFPEQVKKTTKIDFGRLLHKSREIDGFAASLAADRKLPHIFRLRIISMETRGDDGDKPTKPAIQPQRDQPIFETSQLPGSLSGSK